MAASVWSLHIFPPDGASASLIHTVFITVTVTGSYSIVNIVTAIFRWYPFSRIFYALDSDQLHLYMYEQ